MRKRIEILLDIVNLNGDLASLLIELEPYNWEESAQVFVTSEHINRILRRVKSGEVSFGTLEYWAKAILMRQDIDFDNENDQEIITELATPELFGYLIHERLERL